MKDEATEDPSGPEMAASLGVSSVYVWQLTKGKRRKIDDKAARIEALEGIAQSPGEVGVVGQTVAGLMSSTLQAQYGKPPLSG